jgi:hypothetical protein
MYHFPTITFPGEVQWLCFKVVFIQLELLSSQVLSCNNLINFGTVPLISPLLNTMERPRSESHLLIRQPDKRFLWFSSVITGKQNLKIGCPHFLPNSLSISGIPNFFWMATHLTKLPRFHDTPLTMRPPPPPSTRLEKKIHNYIIKTNEPNLTARFSYLIMSKAEFRLMTSNFKI